MLIPLSVQAQMALQCSPANSTSVAINELFTGGGGEGNLEFLELYFNEARDIAGWTLYWKDKKNEATKIFTLGTGAHQAISYLPDGSTYSDDNCPVEKCTTPTTFPKGTFLVYDLVSISPNSGEFLLVDTADTLTENAPVVVNYFYYYNKLSQIIQSYTIPPEPDGCSLSFVSTSDNKDMSRLTDGEGDIYTEYPNGDPIEPTTGESNMGGGDPAQFETSVSITKTVDQAAVIAGTGISYTITVTNNGPSTATDIVVTDIFPDDKLDYTGFSTNLDDDLSPFGTFDETAYTWEFGLLPVGSSAELKIFATVKSTATGSVINSASIDIAQTNTSGNTETGEVSVEIVELDHLRIEHAATSLTCMPEEVVIRACLDQACTQYYTDSVEVSLTLPDTGWSSNPVTVSGGAATVSLRHFTAEAVDLAASATSPAAAHATRCFTGATESTCQIIFKDSGFIFAVPDHAAETTQTVAVKAVATDDATWKCIPAFQNVTRTVSFWSTYLNPDNGTEALLLAGTEIAGASPGTALALAFDATGEAALPLRYPDVGKLRLDALYEGSGQEAGLTLSGWQSFVVRPDHFTLTDITCADGTANPGTTDAGGAAFCRAGQSFAVTVAARNASNDTTLNYGRESPPESVALTANLVAPPGGADPALNGGFGTFGEDCAGNPAPAGTACGMFSWDEVGIITLLPRVGDDDYLGAGNVTGTASGNVGRFFPARFTVASDPGVPSFKNGCTSGGSHFTYLGESFYFNSPPKLTITAVATGGTTTANYDCGGFWKLGANLDYTYSDSGAATVLLPTNGSPRDFTGTSDCDGSAAITLTDSFRYKRPAAAASTDPFAANVTLDIDKAVLTDDDSVCYEEAGTCSGWQLTGITFDPAGELRHGRIKVFDNFGPDGEAITGSPFALQYYDGSGWVTNSDDECIAPADLSFCPGTRISDIQLNGAPGEGMLTVSAGSSGEHLDVCGVNPPRLSDPPDCGTPDGSCGEFTFGIYRGNDRIINWQEVMR